MDLKQYTAAVEAMLFAHAEPLTSQKLADVLEIEQPVVERLLLALRDEYEKPEHGICLLQEFIRHSFTHYGTGNFGNYIIKASNMLNIQGCVNINAGL